MKWDSIGVLQNLKEGSVCQQKLHNQKSSIHYNNNVYTLTPWFLMGNLLESFQYFESNICQLERQVVGIFGCKFALTFSLWKKRTISNNTNMPRSFWWTSSPKQHAEINQKVWPLDRCCNSTLAFLTLLVHHQ